MVVVKLVMVATEAVTVVVDVVDDGDVMVDVNVSGSKVTKSPAFAVTVATAVSAAIVAVFVSVTVDVTNDMVIFTWRTFVVVVLSPNPVELETMLVVMAKVVIFVGLVDLVAGTDRGGSRFRFIVLPGIQLRVVVILWVSVFVEVTLVVKTVVLPVFVLVSPGPEVIVSVDVVVAGRGVDVMVVVEMTVRVYVALSDTIFVTVEVFVTVFVDSALVYVSMIVVCPCSVVVSVTGAGVIVEPEPRVFVFVSPEVAVASVMVTEDVVVTRMVLVVMVFEPEGSPDEEPASGEVLVGKDGSTLKGVP